ncbi:MAG: hypothetical protein SNJ76_01220 [Fimbriimonadaceae bacterium]
MIWTTLALGAVASFSGGPPSDLAAFLASEAGRPAVIAFDSAAALPAMSLPVADPNELARTLRNTAKLHQMPGLPLTFSTGTLPRHLFEIGAIRRQRQPGTSAPNAQSLSVRDGRASISMKGTEAMTLSELQRLPWSRPLDYHWIGAEYALAISADKVPEVDLLREMARAVGARLVVGRDAYTFQIEPEEVRRRALRTLRETLTPEQIQRLSDRDRMDLDLAIAVLQNLPANNIVEMLRAPETETRVPLGANPALQQAAVQYLNALVRLAQTPPNGPRGRPGPAGPGPLEMLRDQPDPGQPDPGQPEPGQPGMGRRGGMGPGGPMGGRVPLAVLQQVDLRQPGFVAMNGRFRAYLYLTVVNPITGQGQIRRF